ncbi:MAG: S-methyl-5'-thioinosine phosphorylase [Gammaproteobacteria bacterium]|nr:MAG: S-methyl-5'-thioinosine phosphorylase [Gammaproteobacteria bacterium]TDJ39664.1 MAG: S-methyl-5'-thioinosine phosphorylase [Gammaproteobacteria bacterium]
MTCVALIGGTGLNSIDGIEALGTSLQTPYGLASAPLGTRRWAGHDVLFLARHGRPHQIAPHRINYRANLWLLQQQGADCVIATNAVGGITSHCAPGAIVLPDQLIDYSWGREHSYADEQQLRHVEFGVPYHAGLRATLMAAAEQLSMGLVTSGTYGCTQGPRLETAAEIDRMERDGCDLVGMTGMPEAGLARELDLPYVALCLVVNEAAGRGTGPIDEGEIGRVSRAGMGAIVKLLDGFFELLE